MWGTGPDGDMSWKVGEVKIFLQNTSPYTQYFYLAAATVWNSFPTANLYGIYSVDQTLYSISQSPGHSACGFGAVSVTDNTFLLQSYRKTGCSLGNAST